MKSRYSCLLVFISLLFCNQLVFCKVSDVQIDYKDFVIISTKTLQIRATPNIKTPIVFSKQSKNEIKLLATKGDWCKIKYTDDNRQGWIYKNMLLSEIRNGCYDKIAAARKFTILLLYTPYLTAKIVKEDKSDELFQKYNSKNAEQLLIDIQSNEEKYNNDEMCAIRNTLTLIELKKYDESMLLEIYSEKWGEAIKNDRDFNDELLLISSIGSMTFLSPISVINYKFIKEKLNTKIKNTKTYEREYNLLLELFSVYSQIHDLALNPSGSLITFNMKKNDLNSEYAKVHSKISVFVQD